MDVNPTRFAVAVTAALACVIVGLLVGMRAGGGGITDHLVRIERTTTLAAPQRADAAARTVTTAVTRTVTRTVTVPVTVTAAAPAARRAAPRPGPGHDKGPGHHKGHGPKHGGGKGGPGPG
jgi:hypothetical protein